MRAGRGLFGGRTGNFLIAAVAAVTLFVAVGLVLEAFPHLGGVQLTAQKGPKKPKCKDNDPNDNNNGGGNSSPTPKPKGPKTPKPTPQGPRPNPSPCPSPIPSPTVLPTITPLPSCSPGGYGQAPGCATPGLPGI
jgi:outer membrane biosynthesis protein TonB